MKLDARKYRKESMVEVLRSYSRKLSRSGVTSHRIESYLEERTYERRTYAQVAADVCRLTHGVYEFINVPKENPNGRTGAG